MVQAHASGVRLPGKHQGPLSEKGAAGRLRDQQHVTEDPSEEQEELGRMELVWGLPQMTWQTTPASWSGNSGESSEIRYLHTWSNCDLGHPDPPTSSGLKSLLQEASETRWDEFLSQSSGSGSAVLLPVRPPSVC